MWFEDCKSFLSTPIHSTVKKLQPIEIRQIRRTRHEKLFNGLIEHHHYLGYTQPVGEHLKYICFSAERPIACFAFSSAPYKLLHRDRFIGWSAEALERNRHLLAYNSRFLILPWIHVPHLASHLLGKCAGIISADWQTVYQHPIYWLETFVDTERFKGDMLSSRELAISRKYLWSWQIQQDTQQLTSIKALYGLPLVKDFQKMLCE